jgi:tetratricopeptide (TPR) repeat protein
MPFIKLRNKRCDDLLKQLNLLDEKIFRLESQYYIETDVSRQFKLEKEIEFAKNDRNSLEQRIELVEEQLKNPFSLNTQSIKDYTSYYEFLSETDSQDGSTFYVLGLLYLKLKLYDLAIDNFKKAIKRISYEADIYYYLALSMVRGRRPKTLNLQDVRMIERYVEAAIQLDEGQANYYYFLAILRFDYYFSNGLSVPSPSYLDLLQTAANKNYNYEEIEMLMNSIIIRDDRLRAVLLRK